MILLLGAALAAIPDGVVPVAAPVDAPDQFAVWAATQGRVEALACDALWPGQVLLCFRVQEGRTRRWVTQADLGTWGTTLPDLRAFVTGRAEAQLGLEKVRVQDMPAHYWTHRDAAGWSVAGILRPELLQAAVGGPVLAALPTDGVLLAWPAGDSALDKVMAVAVREMVDQDGLSAVVHRWDGRRWTPFVEAKPGAPGPGGG